MKLLLGVIVLVGAVLRFATLDEQSFWVDEALTAQTVREPLGEVASAVAHGGEASPPLYFYVLALWAKVFGHGEVGLRSLSALLGTLTILAAYYAGRELSSRRVGLVAAALVAVNPFLVWYSQEARPYALLVLLSVIGFTLFVRALRDPSGRTLAWWAGVSALMMATHWLAALVVLTEAVWLLAVGWRRRPVLLAAGGLVAIQLALVPLALTQGSRLSEGFSVYHLSVAEALKRTASIPKQFLLNLEVPSERLFVAAAVVLVVAAGWLLVRRGEPDERRLAVTGAVIGGVPIAVSFVGLLIASDAFLPRHLLSAWFPLALALAVALGGRRAGAPGLLVALALCCLSLSLVLVTASDATRQRADWRGAAAAAGEARGPRAIVVPTFQAQLPLEHYLGRLVRLERGETESVEVSEVALLGVARNPLVDPPVWRSAQLPRVPGMSGPRRQATDTYTVVTYRARAPLRITLAGLRARFGRQLEEADPSGVDRSTVLYEAPDTPAP